MAVKKTKLQQRIESGEIIEQKCWQYIKEHLIDHTHGE